MPRHYQTPYDRMTDPQGRPYFLWDVDLSLGDFRARIREGDPDLVAMWIGKLMRQAKPDDVFAFVELDRIIKDWPSISRHLGRSLPFWSWLLSGWKELRGD